MAHIEKHKKLKKIIRENIEEISNEPHESIVVNSTKQLTCIGLNYTTIKQLLDTQHKRNEII